MPTRFALTLVLSVPLLVGGCYRKVSDPWAELRRFADAPPDQRENGGEVSRPYLDWGYAILLRSFEGRSRVSRADKLIDRLVREQGFDQVWFKDIGDRRLVYRGRFDSPEHPGAQRMLAQTRATQVAGEQPFANVALVSLGTEDQQQVADGLDLRQHAGKYSLQIAYFDAEFGQDFRGAAEAAAKRMREAGEQAFYYHGPTMSMVTIGVFGLNDIGQRVTKGPNGIDQIQPVYSDRVMNVQRRFPYNVPNGKMPKRNSVTPPASSFLVRVPY